MINISKDQIWPRFTKRIKCKDERDVVDMVVINDNRNDAVNVNLSQKSLGLVKAISPQNISHGGGLQFKERRYTRRVYKLGKPSSSSLFFLLMILIIHSIYACSETTTLVTNQNDCEINSIGVQICTLKTSIRISGPPIGQSTCINVLSPTKSILGYMSITAVSQYYVCQKSDLYYTAQSSLRTSVESRCPGQEDCDSASDCAKFLVDDKLQSILFPSSVNKLARFRCSTPNGCAGNGCWRCDNGCSYLSMEFSQEKDEIYEVFECPTWVPKLSLEIKFHNIDNMNDYQVSLVGESQQRNQGMTIALVSRSSPLSNLDFCIIATDGLLYAAECQKAPELMPGSIGEIRCPSKSDAESLSSKCLMNENVYEVSSSNWDFVATNNQINIKKAIERFKLPVHRGASVIDSFSNGEVFMKQTVGDLMEIQIDEGIYCSKF